MTPRTGKGPNVGRAAASGAPLKQRQLRSLLLADNDVGQARRQPRWCTEGHVMAEGLEGQPWRLTTLQASLKGARGCRQLHPGHRGRQGSERLPRRCGLR